MSTIITINTGGDELLARNAQQVQANRFVQVERENSKKVEADGENKREQRLAAEGRNADGSLNSGNYQRIRRLDPEPAANRSAGIETFIALPSNDAEIVFTEGDRFFSVRRQLVSTKSTPLKYTAYNLEGLSSPPEIRSNGPFQLPYLYTTPVAFGGFDFEVGFAADENGIVDYSLNAGSKPAKNFTVEYVFKRFNSNSRRMGVGFQLSAYGVIYTFGAVIGTGEILGLSAGKIAGDQNVTIADEQLDTSTFPVSDWNTAAVVLNNDILSLFWNGQLVLNAALSEAIPAMKYKFLVQCSTSLPDGSIDPIESPNYPFGWAGTRFTTSARYTGDYTPGPINTL